MEIFASSQLDTAAEHFDIPQRTVRQSVLEIKMDFFMVHGIFHGLFYFFWKFCVNLLNIHFSQSFYETIRRTPQRHGCRL